MGQDQDILPAQIAARGLAWWTTTGRARALREQAGLDLASMAEILTNPSRQYQTHEISSWENGAAVPSVCVRDYLQALRELQRTQDPNEVTEVSVVDELGHYRLLVPVDDHIGLAIAATSRPFEHRLLATLKTLLKEGDRIVDVGANIGNHSVAFARVGCEVEAFEPNPTAYSLLVRNLEINGLSLRVKPYDLALGQIEGRGALSIPIAGNLGSGTIRPTRDGDVALTTLDATVKGDVRLIKIDAEGAEADVLRGASTTLQRCRPLVVAELRDRAATREVSAMLSPLGYRRLPIRLTGDPTYLFAARARPLLRAAVTPGVGYHAVRRAGSQVKRIIRRV